MMERVLILDDDLAVGKTIAFIAKSIGMEARAVARPDDFFRAVDRWNPTHIVLDLVMPEMDGVEIMRHLAERRCTARIIILSGVSSRVLDAARRTAAEKGLRVAGVLSKPIIPVALRAFLADSSRDDVAQAGSLQAADTGEHEITAADLRRAIDGRQFGLVYQPKIDCTTGTLAGFEALVRWHHPVKGMLMPDLFIPLAEKLDLIDEITQQVLDEGIRWISGARLAAGLSLSVNLSARTLVDLKFADRLARLCRDATIDPEHLILELTETTAMEDPVLALDMVTRLRMKGFHVSIDDVGTGYSSMAQLARLPFSEMKVDKSFVMTATASQESRTIIRSIIELGHNLNLRVTAEGVEDENTLEFLKDTGCDFAQGYFIARPMPGNSVAEWIGQRH